MRNLPSRLGSAAVLHEAASRTHKTVGLGLLLLYGHFLQPADFAVLALLYLTTTMIETLATQGLTAQVLVQLGLQREGEATRRTLSTALYHCLLVAMLLFGTLAIFAVPLEKVLFSRDPGGHLLRLMALAGFLRTGQNLPRHLLRLRQRERFLSLLRLAETLFAAGLNVFFLAGTALGLKGVVYAEVLREILASALLISILRRELTLVYSRAALRAILRLGLPRLGRELPTLLLGTNDRYVLLYFVTLPLLGAYAFALRMAQSLADLAVQPLLGIVPSLQREIPGTAENRLVLGRFVTYFLALSGLLALALAVFAEPLLRLLAAPFVGAATVLPVLLAAVLCGGLQRVLLAFVPQRARLWRVITGTAAGLSLLGNLLLVPPFGIWGAAFVTLLLQGSLCLAARHLQRRTLAVAFEVGRLAKVTAALCCTYYISRFVTPEPLLGQLAAAAAMVFLYPALLGVFGFYTLAEIDQMRYLLNRRVAILPNRAPEGVAPRRAAGPADPKHPELVGAGAGRDGTEASHRSRSSGSP